MKHYTYRYFKDEIVSKLAMFEKIQGNEKKFCAILILIFKKNGRI